MRRDDAHDYRVTQAWLTGALTQRKIPKLETLLAKRDMGQESPQQMRQTLHAIAEAYKLKIRKGNKKGKKR